MHGDFSNVTFSPDRHYSTVFDLQGRVGLDANRNEQTAILLHYLRTAMADLVGPNAGPDGTDLGFAVGTPSGGDLPIGKGRYYVDGVLVENPADTSYLQQPDALLDSTGVDKLPEERYLVYLKAWERHITEVEEPALHEPALGLHHPDSSSRAKVLWQVRAVPTGPGSAKKLETLVSDWIAQARSRDHSGILQVRTSRPDDADDDPCAAAPDSAYTGENQLYRVEIRGGGPAGDGASFAWSRDNASVIYPITKVEDAVVQVTSLGRDWHTTLEVGQWVEVVDDAVSTRRELGWPLPAAPLRQVVDLDVDTMAVRLDATVPAGVGTDPKRHPYLRRWDHTPPAKASDGAIPVVEAPVGDKDAGWIPLERGIEVRFLAGDANNPNQYRSGDHWVFAARRTLGDVIWPYPDGSPPHGVAYHYAPLAVVDAGTVTEWRTSFKLTLTRL